MTDTLDANGLAAAKAAYAETLVDDGLGDEAYVIRAYLAALREAPVPSEEPVAWCQPMDCGKHTPRKFIVRFEDADKGDAIFDNEAEARDYWERANGNWNCYLFGALPRVASPAVAPVADAKQKIIEFAQAILHGDDEHRGWLMGAALAFNAGDELPAPRGKGTGPVAPVAVSVKPLLERCTAREGKETAAQIEAEVTARLEPEALSVAKQTFRAFAASWEGSIAVAIAAYLDARILSSIIPATKGGEHLDDAIIWIKNAMANKEFPPAVIERGRAVIAALAQDTGATPPSDTEEKAL